MPAGKLGLRPFQHTLKTMRQAVLTARILDQLGAPPSASPGYSGDVDKLLGGDWGMDGNGDDPANPTIVPAGDCVFADCAHRIALRTAMIAAITGSTTKPVIATAAETIALYSEVTGYDPNDPNTDQGGDLVTTAQYMQKTGMLIGGVRHTEDGNGIIDPANVDHIRWAICLFGCAPFGLNLPQSALDQFDAGQPWDVAGDGTIVGGHDVLGVEYRTESPTNPGWLIVTWGKRWPATNAFIAKYCDEVVPVGAKDFITANGLAPSGINLAQTLQLLSEIN